jgi:hypothetical protein
MKKSRNNATGQIVPLENARAVAKPKRVTFRAFNRFIDDIEELGEYTEGLKKLLAGNKDRCADEVEFEDAEYCRELVARCKAGLERFDHAENYDEDDDGERVLCHAHIAKRIGIMVASFPNANPTDAEGYVQMLVEHVAATGVSELSLGSACREIVETQKFAPAISEVLDVIKQHIELWRSRRFVIREAEGTRLAVINRLRERERKEQEEEREREFQQAISAVKNAMAMTRSVAQEIKNLKQSMEFDKKALAKLCEQHARAEQRESELLRALRKLAVSEEELAAAAAAKLDGFGCGELSLH